MDTSEKLSNARTQFVYALDLETILTDAYWKGIDYMKLVPLMEQLHVPGMIGTLHDFARDLHSHVEGLRQKVKNLEKVFEKECLAAEGTDKHGTMLPPAPAQDVFVEPK